MACAHDNNFTIGNTHVRLSLMRVLPDDLAANELHNANDNDQDQHRDVGDVDHVAGRGRSEWQKPPRPGLQPTTPAIAVRLSRLMAVMVVPRAIAATLSLR